MTSSQGVLAMTPSAGYIKFVPGAVSLSKALAQSNGEAYLDLYLQTCGFNSRRGVRRELDNLKPESATKR